MLMVLFMIIGDFLLFVPTLAVRGVLMAPLSARGGPPFDFGIGYERAAPNRSEKV
jgi:hypothetical protein